MNPDRTEYFRKKLEALVAELDAELDGETKDSEKIVELDSSIGRLSRMDAMQSQQMALELRRRKEQQLMRVQNALKRGDRGTYGVCGKCRVPMPEVVRNELKLRTGLPTSARISPLARSRSSDRNSSGAIPRQEKCSPPAPPT
jgi:DnaK suppressor protein